MMGGPSCDASTDIGLIAAVEEELRIGREAGVRVNISHIKALGPVVWGKSTEVIALIKQARAEGIKVTADHPSLPCARLECLVRYFPPVAIGFRLTG